MALANFRMIINKLLNNDPYIVPEKAPIIILGRNSAVRMTTNCKYTKHTRHIAIRVSFVRNGEKLKKCTRLTGVREVYNCHTLQLRMLGIMI